MDGDDTLVEAELGSSQPDASQPYDTIAAASIKSPDEEEKEQEKEEKENEKVKVGIAPPPCPAPSKGRLETIASGPKSPKASGGNASPIASEISSDFDSGVLFLGTPKSVTAVSTPSTSPTKSPKVSVGNGMRERAEWFIDKQRMNVGRSVGTTRRRVALLLGGERALKS